jgi:PhnB protein
MASILNPYIMFDGTARAAITFYQQVLGGEVIINTFGEAGMAGDGVDPEGIMHAQLVSTNGYTIMASDTPPGMSSQTHGPVSLSISGDDPELRTYFSQLLDGGEIQVPLAKQAWGDEFGAGVDKFGVNWMVNLSSRQ